MPTFLARTASQGSKEMIHQYPFALLLLLLNVAIATAGPLESKRDAGAQCPPGYWCQKKRDIDSSSCPADFYCNPSNKRNQDSDSGCPGGYWCSKRSNVILDETDADSCPPGYWCSKRKRDAVAQCPPGYWCSKRSLEDVAETACPPGYWCSRDQVEESEANPCPSAEILCKKESNVIHKETNKEDCPDAHWCRKRRQVDY